MKQGTIDLFNSERGVFALLLVISSTVLVITGHLDVDTWVTYTKWIGVTLIASKTITTAWGIHTDGKVDQAAIASANSGDTSGASTATTEVKTEVKTEIAPTP